MVLTCSPVMAVLAILFPVIMIAAFIKGPSDNRKHTFFYLNEAFLFAGMFGSMVCCLLYGLAVIFELIL